MSHSQKAGTSKVKNASATPPSPSQPSTQTTVTQPTESQTPVTGLSASTSAPPSPATSSPITKAETKEQEEKKAQLFITTMESLGKLIPSSKLDSDAWKDLVTTSEFHDEKVMKYVKSKLVGLETLTQRFVEDFKDQDLHAAIVEAALSQLIYSLNLIRPASEASSHVLKVSPFLQAAMASQQRSVEKAVQAPEKNMGIQGLELSGSGSKTEKETVELAQKAAQAFLEQTAKKAKADFLAKQEVLRGARNSARVQSQIPFDREPETYEDENARLGRKPQSE